MNKNVMLEAIRNKLDVLMAEYRRFFDDSYSPGGAAVSRCRKQQEIDQMKLLFEVVKACNDTEINLDSRSEKFFRKYTGMSSASKEAKL